MRYNLKQVMEILKYMKTFEKVTITLGGSGLAKQFYHIVTRPHSTYKIIPNKKYGVGLIRIPENFDDFLKGKIMQAMRTNRNKALKKGYHFQPITGTDYLDDIYEINCSAENRQGNKMKSAYTDKTAVKEFLESGPIMFGVLNSEGKLVAYISPWVLGDFVDISKLLGHEDYNNDGIMYLLVSGLVEELSRQKTVKYLMYDTFIGAQPGLRYFKERLGFQPYVVKWVWDENKKI